MKKMKTILLGFVLVVSMMLNVTSYSFANERVKVSDITKISGYYEQLSSYTGIPVNELKKLEKKYGELTQYMGIKVDVNRLGNSRNITLSSSSGGGSDDPMTKAQFTEFKNAAKTGDILVTKDSWTLFVNHGHAAIVESDNVNGDKYIVQAIGPGEKSRREKIDSWASCYTARIYYPTSATSSQRTKAGSYSANLTNIDYDAFADVESSSEANCATIIWKAYKNQGISLDTSIMLKYVPIPGTTTGIWVPYNTCYPVDFVECSNTTMRKSINWSGASDKW
ncbi:MAG: hypothetical protein GX213_14735 [Clostridiaceae bacterium]|nr:hypothetical protein [Clostridiaceae bacterium]